jgi:anti-sigma factor RsiW
MTDDSRCEAMEEKVMLLVYDELPDDDVAAVQSHIAECDMCRTAYRELKESASLLDESTASLPPLTLSDEERTNILMSILDDEESLTGNPKRDGQPACDKSFIGSTAFWLIVLIAIATLCFGAYRLLQG